MAIRTMSSTEASQNPTMVIGCANLKGTRLAMFNKSDKLATRAQTRDTAFTAMSLRARLEMFHFLIISHRSGSPVVGSHPCVQSTLGDKNMCTSAVELVLKGYRYPPGGR